MREFDALLEQRTKAREYESRMIAALRADLYNTSAKEYKRTFEAKDFLSGGDISTADVEKRAKEYMAQGVPPAAAVAMASSKKSKSDNLRVLDAAGRAAAAAKAKGKNRRMA